MREMRPPTVYSRLLFGLVVIAVGVIFMLDKLGMADAGHLLRWWPSVIVLMGVVHLTGINGHRNLAAGTLMTIVGGWMLLHSLHLVSLDIWDLWPVILILIGAGLITRSVHRGSQPVHGDDVSAHLNAFALWSGVERKVSSQDFQGGEITAIMGGHEIDLRNARMQGNSAVIDLFVWWGGVEMRVPTDWRVSCETQLMMGGIVDKSEPVADAKGTLILKGMIVMGGLEVKN